MKRVHFTEKYLLNPQHPITVDLIGAGGTGSQVLTCLARLDTTLRALDHPGLFITLYDPDEVSAANIGRQLFCESEFGLNKSQCLITRVNRFFGNDWVAVPRTFPINEENEGTQVEANIIITCTDNVQSRLDISGVLKRMCSTKYKDNTTPFYWLDFGNSHTTGQVVLGTINTIQQPKSKKYETISNLKVITEHSDLSQINEEDTGPSCSMAEAITKQDLFINSVLAHIGCNLLWKLFRNAMIDYCGLYLNLDTMKMNPIGL